MAIIRNRSRSFAEVHNSGKIKDVREAMLFAKNNGLCLSPFDVAGFLPFFNIELVQEDMEDISGYIEKRGDCWKIGINQYDHPRRKRFTIAHELGHFILHKNIIEKEGRHNDAVLMRSGAVNKIEQEANLFATQLLMPRSRILKYIKDNIKTIEGLAEKFEVSAAAMRYRLLRLGYLIR